MVRLSTLPWSQRLGVVAAIAAMFIATNVRGASADGPDSAVRVGAFYFPGWCQADRWHCIAANPKVQHPLLGYYREGDPRVADWHIRWAREHGIGFFAFDYYTARGSQHLETALDQGFLRSQQMAKFKFCLNWCNHAPYTTMTAAELDAFGDLVIPRYLKHPSYLRVNGKPVVMILSGYSFVKNLGVDGAKAAFDRFKQRCSDAGLGGAYLVFCEGETNGVESLRQSLAAGADAFCMYNYPYAGSTVTGPGRHAENSYQHLTQQAIALWKGWREGSGGAFWPTVMPGWDRRPWLKDADLIRTGSTPALFEQALRQARSYVNRDRVVMVEAWNEWGEGSVLEPSREHGFGYLDAVRSVFAPQLPHTHTTPSAKQAHDITFPITLPAQSTWRFDFGAEGWTGANVTGFRTEWGALRAVSTNDDPQFVSAKCYLPCSAYRAIKLRMRLEGATQGVETGQLFWSTTDQAMSERTSASFTVQRDGKWHDYLIDLSACPGWRGLMDQLRLDPCASPNTVIEVDHIEVVVSK